MRRSRRAERTPFSNRRRRAHASACADTRRLKPPLYGCPDVASDRGAITIGAEMHPAAVPGQPDVAFPDATEQREIALVFIAIRRFAARGYLRRDIQQKGDVGLR